MLKCNILRQACLQIEIISANNTKNIFGSQSDFQRNFIEKVLQKVNFEKEKFQLKNFLTVDKLNKNLKIFYMYKFILNKNLNICIFRHPRIILLIFKIKF